jgi:hypothetical protein
MTLQILPPEILLHILSSTTSLSDLHALARTSPRLYAVYRREQAALMYQALAADLGPVMADALGLARVQVVELSSQRQAREYISRLEDSLSAYAAYLAEGNGDQGRAGPSPRRLELDYVLRLARWYRAVEHVAGVYMTCALRLFEREVRPSCCPDPRGSIGSLPTGLDALVAPPSRSERLRVLRAFYRLQILHHIWGSRAHCMTTYNPVFDRINLFLFGLWEVWETQQVFCAGTFYQRFRGQLADMYFGETSRDPLREVLESNTRFTFDEFRDFVGHVRAADEAAWQKTLDQASSLASGARDAGETEERALAFFRGRLYECYVRENHPPPRHGFPVSFQFDRDCVGAVPFGWVDAFDGHYEYDLWERLGGIRRQGKPTQGLWSRLGFVMWDAPRVMALKTSSFLSHCKTGWARSGRSSWD